jgi:hypothetical protein
MRVFSVCKKSVRLPYKRRRTDTCKEGSTFEKYTVEKEFLFPFWLFGFWFWFCFLSFVFLSLLVKGSYAAPQQRESRRQMQSDSRIDDGWVVR